MLEPRNKERLLQILSMSDVFVSRCVLPLYAGGPNIPTDRMSAFIVGWKCIKIAFNGVRSTGLQATNCEGGRINL